MAATIAQVQRAAQGGFARVDASGEWKTGGKGLGGRVVAWFTGIVSPGKVAAENRNAIQHFIQAIGSDTRYGDNFRTVAGQKLQRLSDSGKPLRERVVTNVLTHIEGLRAANDRINHATADGLSTVDRRNPSQNDHIFGTGQTFVDMLNAAAQERGLSPSINTDAAYVKKVGEDIRQGVVAAGDNGKKLVHSGESGMIAQRHIGKLADQLVTLRDILKASDMGEKEQDSLRQKLTYEPDLSKEVIFSYIHGGRANQLAYESGELPNILSQAATGAGISELAGDLTLEGGVDSGMVIRVANRIKSDFPDAVATKKKILSMFSDEVASYVASRKKLMDHVDTRSLTGTAHTEMYRMIAQDPSIKKTAHIDAIIAAAPGYGTFCESLSLSASGTEAMAAAYVRHQDGFDNAMEPLMHSGMTVAETAPRHIQALSLWVAQQKDKAQSNPGQAVTIQRDLELAFNNLTGSAGDRWVDSTVWVAEQHRQVDSRVDDIARGVQNLRHTVAAEIGNFLGKPDHGSDARPTREGIMANIGGEADVTDNVYCMFRDLGVKVPLPELMGRSKAETYDNRFSEHFMDAINEQLKQTGTLKEGIDSTTYRDLNRANFFIDKPGTPESLLTSARRGEGIEAALGVFNRLFDDNHDDVGKQAVSKITNQSIFAEIDAAFMKGCGPFAQPITREPPDINYRIWRESEPDGSGYRVEASFTAPVQSIMESDMSAMHYTDLATSKFAFAATFRISRESIDQGNPSAELVTAPTYAYQINPAQSARSDAPTPPASYDPVNGSIAWFTERLSGEAMGGGFANDLKNLVNFAQRIDNNMEIASGLLEKSKRKPLNEKEQREVNALLSAGKYNLEQIQRWSAIARSEFSIEQNPAEREFITNMQERLADRHMNLADMMCLYDLDQTPSEQAVSRVDRIDHNLVAVDAALKVAQELDVSGLPGAAKQQLVEVLGNYRADLGKAKDVFTGSSASDSTRVLPSVMWDMPLIKGKKRSGDHLYISGLHQHWDAKAAGEKGGWLPLAHPRLSQERVLKEFVSYQLKQAGVSKKDMPDLKFGFKEATNRVLNERPWEPIKKDMSFAVDVDDVPRTVRSTITPAKGLSGNGVCCGDRMQYTHVPNLARTELTDGSGKTLFSALRHGVLDAYDISASTLRKLPEQELTAMVKELVEHTSYDKSDYRNAEQLAPPPLPPSYSKADWDSTFPGINEQITYLDEVSNSCPEQCAVFAARHFGLECKFDAFKNDDQIDLSYPVGALAGSDGAHFTDGSSEEACLNHLQGKDKDSIYLMRTGQNGMAGHNQMLYSQDNEWFAYDTPSRQAQLTSNGSLTDEGRERMVKPFATWGMKRGESSIAITPVTERGAKLMIEFIKDSRTESEDVAIQKAYENNEQMERAESSHVDSNDIATVTANVHLNSSSLSIEAESPYADMDFGSGSSEIDSAGQAQAIADAQRPTFSSGVSSVDQIVDDIRTNKSKASTYASKMRTAASANMAKELAVAALVNDPDKLKAALAGETVDISLSSISLLTPDRLRTTFFQPQSNEREMLRRQTEALNNLGGREQPVTLQVRDASGGSRLVRVNCKVRTFNFGVNAGAVGTAKRIPSHTRGWDKLMGWGYAMERNNPELRALLGDPNVETLGGDVADKLMALEDKCRLQETDSEVAASNLDEEVNKTTQRNIITLQRAAADAKQIWREGSYNKGGEDPYKMVSRLGVVINEMDETLAFNCKSGKDRTGQLDAELKYLTALSAADKLPDIGAPASPELRQMRSDFTLHSGNLEMQRMNTGLPGFKLNIKEVPGLANYIASPEMEPMYHGGSDYIKS